MKAEHRHELKTNDLAKSLITFQDYVKQYGGRVALGIAIVILAIVLVMQRNTRARAQATQYRDQLATARTIVTTLAYLRSPETDRVPGMLRDVRENTSEKVLQAEALAILGDYNWALAHYVDPFATSRPTTRPGDKSRDEYLREAKNAYQQVLSEYPGEMLSAATARFGLAAIAEEERNLDAAKTQYDAIKNGSAPKEFKDQADVGLKRLDQIRQPILIGQVPEKLELPKPATTQSTTTGTTTTRTAAATTQAAPAAATKSSAAATTRPAK
jgi:hypothetical protein